MFWNWIYPQNNPSGAAGEWATKEEAIALVKRAVVTITEHGPENATRKLQDGFPHGLTGRDNTLVAAEITELRVPEHRNARILEPGFG